MAVNLTTPNVICIVLNKRYFAFTFPIDFAMVMSDPKLQAVWTAFLPHVTRTKRKLSIRYITPAFSGSPWWGEINMATLPLPSWGPHGGEKSI